MCIYVYTYTHIYIINTLKTCKKRLNEEFSSVRGRTHKRKMNNDIISTFQDLESFIENLE